MKQHIQSANVLSYQTQDNKTMISNYTIKNEIK